MQKLATAWSTPGASLSGTPAEALQSLVRSWHARVDLRLDELLPPAAGPEGIPAAMREGVLGPGKRLRPLLMFAAGRALSCDSPALLDAACAVEMVHSASLVLDDMPCMDDARFRRGRLTVHVRHGEDAAVLAAVALLAQACATVAALPGLDGALRARVVCVLCDAVGPRGLVRGQFRDLREGGSARTLQAIAEANDEKTGVLFACALEIAALIAGAPQAVDSLRAAAAEVGQAFQLRDDLDDGTATAGPIDKDRHQDTGKSTMVALLGRAAVEQRLHVHMARAETLVRAVLPKDDVLLDLLRLAFSPSHPTPPAAAHLASIAPADLATALSAT